MTISSYPGPEPLDTPKRASVQPISRVAPVVARRAPAPTLEIVDDDIVEVEDAAPNVAAPRPHAARIVRQLLEELELDATLWHVAGVCAALLRGSLRARAVVIHAHDPRTGELRVIGADGSGTSELLGAVDSIDDDFVACTVFANGKPLLLRLDGEIPRFAPDRLRRVGAVRSFLALPVIGSSGSVAIVEVVDADEALADDALEACSTAAAALLRSHAVHQVDC